MRTVTHPLEQAGPNMVIGFDSDGKQVAIEIIDDEGTLKDLLHYHMADAARYRWLRSNAREIVFGRGNDTVCFGAFDDKKEDLDSAVDAAMKLDE